MRSWNAVEVVLLALAFGVSALAVTGVLLARTTYDRLHYAATTPLADLLVAGAVWVGYGPSIISLEASLLAAFTLIAAPAATHATARSARIAERGNWRPRRGEIERDPEDGAR